MTSLQGSALRLVLRTRRDMIRWDAPVERFRAEARLGEHFMWRPRGVQIQPALASTVPAEWIIPPRAAAGRTILYLHGGGWTIGWSGIYRRMVAGITRASASPCLAPDYRLAPENPFPAALEDCLVAYDWLLQNGTSPQHLVIAGDSAGGNLTLATLLSLRESGCPLPAAAVCICPATDLAGTGETFFSHSDAALTASFVQTVVRHYAGEQDLCSPLLSPLYGDLRGLPPMLIQAGADEILLSDATRLAENARAAGVDVSLRVWPGMWHVWHLFAPFLPEAQQAVEEIGTFIGEKLSIRESVPVTIPGEGR